MEYQKLESLSIFYLRKYKQIVDDENVGEIISAILKADSQYDQNIGSLYGYRKSCIVYAIKTIIAKKNKNSRMILLKDYTPVEQNLSKNDFYHKIFWDDLKKTLTNNEYNVIYSMYGERKTLRETAKQIGCSGENIRLIKNKALTKIRKLYSE